MSDDARSSSLRAYAAGREGRARVVLHVAGLLAIVLALWVPFVDAGGFYRGVIAPGYQMHPDAERAWQVRSSSAAPELVGGGPAWADAALERVELERLAAGESVTLTGLEAWSLGRQMSADGARLPRHGAETATIGRFLMVATAALVVFGALALCLPAVWSPGRVWVNVAVGALGLWVFASHVLTIGIDVLGLVEGGLFTVVHHVCAVALIALTGIGTALPMNASNALWIIGGTFGGFVLLGVASGVWLVV